MAKKKKSKILRIVYLSMVILLASMVYTSYNLYKKVLYSNVVLASRTSAYFYIPKNHRFEDICNDLSEQGIVKNIHSFKWVAEKKNYPSHIYPGKYLIEDGMNNNELVNKLRSGDQESIKVMFQNVRTLEELAGDVGAEIEADSAEIIALLRDQKFISEYGFNEREVLSMFLPNTYEFYWSTTAEDFFKRMAKEYKKFWNQERLNKARALNLSQTEVTTLASIVQAEQTIRPKERPIVAGLYLNRLRKGMKLESDPTIIFALNDFSVKRVLNKDRDIDSPYNTYKYRGLPPGPINIPELNSIEAVLNPQKHDYIFMCAKEDFSGYHNFSNNYKQHTIYANRYRAELNKRKIYR